jgi:hypothetical protein
MFFAVAISHFGVQAIKIPLSLLRERAVLNKNLNTFNTLSNQKIKKFLYKT